MTQQEQTSQTSSVINIGSLFSQAWQTVKKHLGFLMGITVVVFLINLLPSILREAFNNQELIFLVQVAGIVLNLWLSLGVIKIALNLVKNKEAKFEDLFSQGKFLADFVVATIIYDLIVLGGLILLIVPGIIWSLKFQFFPYFIIEKNMSPIEALKASSQITHGDKWSLLLLNIIMLLLNLAGTLALMVGLLITYPITILAMTYAYIHLKSARFKTNSSTPASSTTS